MVPAPLCYSAELFSEITSEDILKILLSLWNFMKFYPPTLNDFSYNPESSSYSRKYPTSLNNQVYLQPVISVITANIKQLKQFYWRFVQFPIAPVEVELEPNTPDTQETL